LEENIKQNQCYRVFYELDASSVIHDNVSVIQTRVHIRVLQPRQDVRQGYPLFYLCVYSFGCMADD